MFTLITSNPTILGGKPCIAGTRISVEFIKELIANGAPKEEILLIYPQLSVEAIEEAIKYK
ncbi:MAG: DUF433 domain-containing protein [bacterium]|nr:DUF433 domain-containing protein [bacterium]